MEEKPKDPIAKEEPMKKSQDDPNGAASSTTDPNPWPSDPPPPKG